MKGAEDTASRTPAPTSGRVGAGGAGPSKGARLWKRTWVGSSLSAVLALLLALAFAPRGAAIVLVAASALALVAILELARMGRFGEHALAAPLGAALGAQLVAHVAMNAVEPLAPVQVLVDLARPIAVGGAAFGLARAFGGSVAARAASVTLLLGLTFATRAGIGEPPRALAFWGTLGLVFAYALGRALDRREERRSFAFVCAFAPWIAFSLPGLASVTRAFGPRGLVALVLLAKVGDVFGYYVGSAIGKRHPFPRTSPGKTIAGCVASLVAAVVCGAVLALTGLVHAPRAPLAAGMAVGAIANLAAQSGDLLESKAKRWAGVKDSASWFGPSGGVLDLVDSLLLAVPAALFTWPLFLTAA